MEHQGDLYRFCKLLEENKSCSPRLFAQGEIQILNSSNELLERGERYL